MCLCSNLQLMQQLQLFATRKFYTFINNRTLSFASFTSELKFANQKFMINHVCIYNIKGFSRRISREILVTKTSP